MAKLRTAVVKRTVLSSPIIIAGLFLLVALFFQAKSLFSFFGGPKDEFKPMDKKKDSISPYMAKAYADKLYTAMSSMGTDEKAIFEVLGLLSGDDFAQVYNAFGKRRYDRFFGNDGLPGLNDELDLIQWIYQELDNADINKIRQINPALGIYFKA